MTVAFDIDQVLCMTVQRGRAVLAADIGVDPDAVRVTDDYDRPYALFEGGQLRPLPIERSFWDRDDVLDGSEPFPGSVEALVRLHRRGLLAGYVTRRPPATRGATERWLRRNGYPDMPVHFVGVETEVASYDLPKSDVCRLIGATHLVDDHATEVSRACEAGIEVIVVDAENGKAARSAVLKRHPTAVSVASAAAAVELIESRMAMAA